MDLRDKALLVDLHITNWTGRKTDRSVSTEISVNKRTKGSGGKFIKNLLPDNPYMKEITKYVNSANTYYMNMTLAWGNKQRLLPVDRLDDWTTNIKLIRDGWEKAVQDMKNNYEDSIENARHSLGELFDYADYPSPNDLRFTFDIKYTSIPGADFRVSVHKDIVEDIRKQIQSDLEDQANDSIMEIIQRFQRNICVLVDALDRENGRLHASLFENLQLLVDTAGSLNIFNDPDIARIIAESRELLVNTPEEIRSNPAQKKLLVNKGTEILNRIKSYARPEE